MAKILTGFDDPFILAAHRRQPMTLRKELAKDRLTIRPFRLCNGPGADDCDYWVEISPRDDPNSSEKIDITRDAYEQVPGAVVDRSVA